MLSEKMKKLEQVAASIASLQETLQKLVNENAKLMKQPMKMMKLIDEALNAIPEQLQSLNLSSQVSCNNFLVSDFDAFKNKAKSAYEVEVGSSVCQGDLSEFAPMRELLKYPNYRASGGVLGSLEKFIDNLEKAKGELKESGVSADSAEQIQRIEALMAKCYEKESRDLNKYVKEFDTRLRSDANSKQRLDEYEKQMDIWWNQPAVKKCAFPTNTVNGKTLDYYTECIERCIAQAKSQHN